MDDNKDITEEVVIESLGSNGDGVITLNEDKVFIPYVLPGEKVIIKPGFIKRNRVISEEVSQKSEDRVEPFCENYFSCGGCIIQHLKYEKYIQFKKNIVTNSLKQHGIDGFLLEDIITFDKGIRQRVSFSYENYKDKLKLGFNKIYSNYIVDIDECPLLLSNINNVIKPLRNLLGSLTMHRDFGHIIATNTKSGLDIAIHFHKQKKELGISERQLIAEFADKNKIARITRGGKELFVEMIKPIVDFSGVDVDFPSGAFLQASKESEKAMIDIILTEIKNKFGNENKLKMADLFSGLGTFSIPLSNLGFVYAYDSAGPAIENLEIAAKKNNLKITAVKEDLFRAPVLNKELAKLDAIILDPPRAGARDQADEIAKTDVSFVGYISCNPGTFARDAKVLIDGGYKLEKVYPVDQFSYTSHIEVVGIFTK